MPQEQPAAADDVGAHAEVLGALELAGHDAALDDLHVRDLDRVGLLDADAVRPRVADRAAVDHEAPVHPVDADAFGQPPGQEGGSGDVLEDDVDGGVDDVDRGGVRRGDLRSRGDNDFLRILDDEPPPAVRDDGDRLVEDDVADDARDEDGVARRVGDLDRRSLAELDRAGAAAAERDDVAELAGDREVLDGDVPRAAVDRDAAPALRGDQPSPADRDRAARFLQRDGRTISRGAEADLPNRQRSLGPELGRSFQPLRLPVHVPRRT